MDIEELQASLVKAKNDSRLFEKSKQYAVEYMQTIVDRKIIPEQQDLAHLEKFDQPLSETATSPHDILEMLNSYGSPATVAQTGGRYFGFVNGNILPSALATKWLADTWDQNPALFVMSPIAAQLEMVCEKWLVELLGLPEQTVAGFVSGTSTATLCGLAAGRDALLAGQGWDVHGQGLMGAPQLKVVVGEQAHATVYKALSLLGLGRDRVISVPADGQGRMIAEALPKLDSTTLLILQAGNVNSGCFDDFSTICDIARKAGAWTHVDGAFGLWAACSPSLHPLTKGVDLADSWSIDAHKTLNAPYDCGVILCRDGEALMNSMQASGSYIMYGDRRDNMLYTPEMSRRARGIDLWATMKSLGKGGIDALVLGLHQRAVQFAESLAKENFHILNDVVFNQVLVACESDECTLETLANIQQHGVCWMGGAKWQGRDVIRISVCSWATTLEDVQKSVQSFVQARDRAQL